MLFDDDIIDLLGTDKDYDMLSIEQECYDFKIGDLLFYNTEKDKIVIEYNNFYDFNNDTNKIYGIVIKKHHDKTCDITLKNFLSANSIIIPYEYYTKNVYNYIAYIKQLFERYISKFKSHINIDIFNFYIPNIAQLDYLLKNIDKFLNVIEKIHGKEKRDDFYERFYTHGLIAQYKNKYYHWIVQENGVRKINNLDVGTPYEILPFFTVKFK